MNVTAGLGAVGLTIGTLLLTACSAGDQPSAETTPSLPTSIVADAGPDQSVFLGTFVTLNGSKSTNANQTGLTYAWKLEKPAGSKAALSDPNIVNPTLTVDVEGTYEATLIVTDAQNTSSASEPDTVIVIASKTNPPPVANVGKASLNVFTDLAVLLDGSKSSDPNGDPLTFQWTIAGKPNGSAPVLLEAATVAPVFTPDIDGTYILRLVVNDGTNSSTPASVTIKASPKPSPTANAGSDQFVLPNTKTITLNGGSSHTNPSTNPPDLEYEWTITSSSFPVTLNNARQPVATFNLPANTAGTVVAQLKVTDKDHPDLTRNSDLDTVMVTVGPLMTIQVSRTDLTTPLLTCSSLTSNCPSITVPIGITLRFDATASAVQPLKYDWVVTPNPESASFSPSSLSGPTPTFTPKADATYTIKLTITDEDNPTNTRTVTRSFDITATVKPSADFTWSPPNPGSGSTVTLNPTIDSDPNLTYEWTLKRPDGASTGLPSVRQPSFTADIAGDYIVTLAVTNPTLTTDRTDTKQKTIRANTNPTADFTVSPNPPVVCSSVNLNGTSSSDSDGSVTSYIWTLTPPDGSSSVLAKTESSTTSFKADKQAAYTVMLTVTDNLGATATVTKILTPEPNPTGKAIFNSNGLSGMTQTTYKGALRGPKCMDCHAPGDNQSGFNLSNPIYSPDFIKSKPIVTGGHTGTKTNLAGEQLISALTALREYLDSTLPTCP
ncbi:MAG: PKD domain-containing protein [Nitrospira sp.]|nr:PKD domain-containing protein [Nitrospira sp.]